MVVDHDSHDEPWACNMKQVHVLVWIYKLHLMMTKYGRNGRKYRKFQGFVKEFQV